MVVRITANVLRASALLALIFGVLSWVGVLPDSLIAIHMLLGIIVVLSLWVLGAVIAMTRGGIGLGIGAIVLGLITLVFGVTQKQNSARSQFASLDYPGAPSAGGTLCYRNG